MSGAVQGEWASGGAGFVAKAEPSRAELDGGAANAGPLFRLCRGVLLGVLAVAFAGCLPYFDPISPLLLFGTYLICAGCTGSCLYLSWPVSRNMASVAPYVLWLFCFFLWGMLSVPNDYVVREGAKCYFKNALVICAIAIALDARTVRTFAQLAQVAVIGNLALCWRELVDPGLIERIAHFHELDATAFNVARPAGLWSNPDEAAFALMFALLLSRWARGPLAWLGRAAAVAGIYLGASRTGAYLLGLCVLLYGWHILRARRGNSARLAAWLAVLFAGAVAAAAVAMQAGWDPTDNWQFKRFLDVTEETRDTNDVSRIEIADAAVQKALHGPWYGSGLFAFQSNREFPAVLEIPAHNIYIAVWGEAGLVGGVTYLLVLGLGVWRLFGRSLEPGDRLVIGLMWLCYLIIGLTWHNQFTAFAGMLYIALLWRLPDALELRPASPPEPHRAAA